LPAFDTCLTLRLPPLLLRLGVEQVGQPFDLEVMQGTKVAGGDQAGVAVIE
jgi:hypothetical protein